MLMHPVRLVDWLPVIRCEFEEPSGLSLTVAQASARWGLDSLKVHALLNALVDVGYLRLSANGVYSRRLN